jgi:hypothetical protein
MYISLFCIFVLFKTRNDIYVSNMSAGAISIDKQVSPLEGLQNHGQIGKGEESGDGGHLSKINSKDTLEILGCSAPNVVKNRKHTQYNNNKKCQW